MDGVPEPLNYNLVLVLRVLILLTLLLSPIGGVVAHWDLEFLNIDLGLLQGVLDGFKLLGSRVQVSPGERNQPQACESFR